MTALFSRIVMDVFDVEQDRSSPWNVFALTNVRQSPRRPFRDIVTRPKKKEKHALTFKDIEGTYCMYSIGLHLHYESYNNHAQFHSWAWSSSLKKKTPYNINSISVLQSKAIRISNS